MFAMDLHAKMFPACTPPFPGTMLPTTTTTTKKKKKKKKKKIASRGTANPGCATGYWTF